MSRYTPPTMLPSAATAFSPCLLPSRKPASRGGRRLSCSCKTTTGDEGRALIDRRDVLLGLTGLAAGSNLGLALAADNACTTGEVKAPMLKCDDKGRDRFFCPAAYKDDVKVMEFSEWKKMKGLPGSDPRSQGSMPAPLRVRRPVHLLLPDEVKRFEDGIRKMKALPDTDPRSFRNQRAIHEAYCDRHYTVVAADSSVTPFDVHFSSIFAPWHRMYIYFFERILEELINDKKPFALPYWNWDAPDGMAIPSIFKDECSPLYHFERKSENLGAFMDLNMGPAKQADLLEAQCTADGYCRQLKDNNLYNMYRQMTVDSPTCFHGSGFCKAGTRSNGSLETGGHTAAHIWVGGDMGSLKTAARDPIFYTNHSNTDRLWHLWSTKLGGNDPMDDEKWLATSFDFYDEKKQPVRISVKDVLDIKKLGYTYEKKERVEWLDKRPKAANLVPTGAQPFLKPRIPEAANLGAPTTTKPIKLKKDEKPIVTVERPEKARAGGLRNQEVLVVDMTVDPCEEVNFEVLVNVPRGQEDMVGPSDSQYVGSYMQVAHGPDGMKMMEPLKVSHRFRLGELIEDLNAGGERTVQVTLVPVNDTKTQIIGMRVEVLC